MKLKVMQEKSLLIQNFPDVVSLKNPSSIKAQKHQFKKDLLVF